MARTPHAMLHRTNTAYATESARLVWLRTTAGTSPHGSAGRAPACTDARSRRIHAPMSACGCTVGTARTRCTRWREGCFEPYHLSFRESCLDLSRFTTESYPEVARGRTRGPTRSTSSGGVCVRVRGIQKLHGTTTSHVSTSGFAFTAIASTPQTLETEPASRRQPDPAASSRRRRDPACRRSARSRGGPGYCVCRRRTIRLRSCLHRTFARSWFACARRDQRAPAVALRLARGRLACDTA